MSIQRELNNRTSKLAAILADANEQITAKKGTAAPNLKNLPDAIGSIKGGGGSGEDITWQDITVTPEAYEVKVTAPEGFGIRSVTIPAEEDYAAENILLGAELWGLKGTHRVGTQLPAEYMDYLTEGVIVCGINYTDFMDSVYVKGGHNFFLAEDETYITIGFMPAEGISITEYNPGSTEFNSYGWVGYRRSKTGDDWAVEDHRLAENAGSCFAQNIKYATSYIEYEGMTLFPVGINNYPDTVTIDYSNFENGSFTETIETGDTLEYAVEIDGDTIKITAADGSIVTAEGIPQGGGEADHSMEDALVSGTLEHYVNDRVTKINDRQYVSIYATPFWWSQEVLKSVSMAKLESMPRDIFNSFMALESVDLPSLKAVGPYAFASCYSLKNINLPAVTTVGVRAFASCDSLTHLVLPNVTEVQNEAFRLENWDSPVVIDLPKVNSFGERPFPTYTNAHILLRNQSIAVANAVLDEGEFEGYIYVSRALVDGYKSAQYWSDLANRIRALEDYTVDGTTTGELDMSKI